MFHRLQIYLDQLRPISPYTGYYLLFEIRNAIHNFATWLDENVSISSPARLIGSEDEEVDPDRRELLQRYSTWRGNIPPDSGTSDLQHVSFAEETLALLAEYVRHVTIHVGPTTLNSGQIESLARVRGQVNSVSSAASFRSTIKMSAEAAEDARSAAKEARDELAKLAEGNLGKTYTQYAQSEDRVAWAYNIAAVILVGVTIVFAVTNQVPADSSLSQTIQHLATFAIVLGLAGYFAKQGSRHRTNATWSRVVSVQLATLSSYLSPVETAEVRDKMRLLFANRAFGSAPDTPAGGDDFSWIQQIVSAIAANRGNP